MAQRISRAKAASSAPVRGSACRPPRSARSGCGSCFTSCISIFNEGYTATSGPDLQRAELTREAIRLARDLHRLLPDDGEVTGLLALMLLTDARRPARTRPDGGLVPLADQDRGLWDAASIAEGVALITDTLSQRPLGPYQLQAAIAAVHGEAARAEDTDWRQIRRPLRAARDGFPEPDGHAQPRGRAGHGARTRGRPRSARQRSTPTTGWPAITASMPSAATSWRWPATSLRPGTAIGGRPANDERPGAALPRRASRCASAPRSPSGR